MTALAVAAFGLAWWLGLYLLARDPRRPLLRRAGAGLLAYALAVACAALADLAPGLALREIEEVLVCLPPLAWAGAVIHLLPAGPGRDRLDRGWQAVALGLVVAVPLLPSPARIVVLAPLAVATVLLGLAWRRVRPRGVPGPVIVAVLLFELGLGALLLPLDVLPHWLLLGAVGLDLAVLGLAVAWYDAFAQGEQVRADLRRSLLAATATALLFGGQVGAAVLVAGRTPALVGLLFGTVAAAIAVVVLAGPVQALLDRLAFPTADELRRERGELRRAEAALPRRPEHVRLAELETDEFDRLTRRALSNYADLGKLVASPLTDLPVIDRRLAARGAPADQPLERAAELKAVLRESIGRLKPHDGDFGTTDEWRHYNALYYCYVVGIRPHRRRITPDGLDPDARRALEWFSRYVPERTLHNWQNAAARLVAADLRADLSQE
ncbi:MAG TPA: hypothetical protein VFR67_06290 [Pilimelia sp.]|nr:hypothetical protein [Pilimelia sp.]